MSQSRNPKDFFKRPSWAQANSEAPPDGITKNVTNSPTAATSPLTEPPSSSFPSTQSPESPAGQRKDTLWCSVKDPTGQDAHQQSFQSGGMTSRDASVGASFTSQRIVKNGREVVISSDGEDTDSIESLESPEDLFARLIPPNNDVTSKKESNDHSTETAAGMGLRSRRGGPGSKNGVKPYKTPSSRVSAPKYKYSLDSLVTATVDDNETEASVAKLRAEMDSENSKAAEGDGAPGDPRKLHEGMLSSTLDDQDDEQGLQRLLDAVRRTEAFDQEKTWSFFGPHTDLPPKLEFPRDCIPPGTYMAVLREPESRDRAFHSGTLEFALSRQFLPDELVTWLFHSVPCEPRDALRQAYSRIFKHATADRVKRLIRPDDIDILFHRLGASSKALALAEPIIADAHPPQGSSEHEPKINSALLAVLDLLRGAADLFADDTRERILCVLFRLTLDTSLTENATICSELERTITATLEGVPEDNAADLAYRTCSSAYNTIKDAIFQSRLLKHIVPTSSWIALFRSRLAVAFLIRDPSPLTEPPETVLRVRRIADMLKEQRFNVKLYKRKDHVDYDYGELGAIATLLNVAIDPGWSGINFPTKEAEEEFNDEMDLLAERIKRVFSAIEDSGASHLKRTLAKESLDALHYRIVYSVRSKPPPKKSLFESDKRGNKNSTLFSYGIQRLKKDTNMPIRGHEIAEGAT